MKRKLPIGEQDFASIRQKGAVYVDKTELIYKLITGSGSQFFFSRPRRFGKSLLCSTFAALFEGRRELFQEIAGMPALAIDKLDWDWKPYPVIRIDLNAGDYLQGQERLETALSTSLENTARKYKIELRGQYPSTQFTNIIVDLHEKYGPVAVIIDEYDKPLLATLDEPKLHRLMVSSLKSFYSVLKSQDGNLKFVFITGVSKFSHISIFSDLNHLTDISLSESYNDLCGFTQKEINANFAPEIREAAKKNKLPKAQYLQELKDFYNGYRFSQNKITVHNPYGLLNHFFDDYKFAPYWFGRGTPTFLINLIRSQKIDVLHLENYYFNASDLQKFDINNMDAVTVLYQTGYLTIVDFDDDRKQYILDYPNREIKSCFSESLVEEYFETGENHRSDFMNYIIRCIFDCEIDKMMERLKSFLKEIPNTIIEDREKYFQTVLHLIFRMFGFNCRSETALSDGRVDTLLETKKTLYLFEFKYDKSAKEALTQIDTKEYLLAWKYSGKELYKIGVNFSGKERNITEWQWVKVTA
ncbi:MAG: ATP-binding protein [Spirochaetaceae bacterium]|jgi:hypothetical protein|nr:ATP-binding protein [Spirochaetaceae bacterium]